MDIEKMFKPAKVLTSEQVEEIRLLTEEYMSLANALNRMPESREKSLCMTKLQESKFFMSECIAKNNVTIHQDCDVNMSEIPTN